MATKQSTIDYLLDQLVSAGDISAKKMFGEYALYLNGKVVGLVCDDKLFIKMTEPGIKFAVGRYKEGHAYPGAKISMLIDADDLDDRSWLIELVRLTFDNLPAPTKKKASPKRE